LDILAVRLKIYQLTDPQGVSWYELNVNPEAAKKPIEAFGIGALGLGSSLFGNKKDKKSLWVDNNSLRK